MNPDMMILQYIGYDDDDDDGDDDDDDGDDDDDDDIYIYDIGIYDI